MISFAFLVSMQPVFKPNMGPIEIVKERTVLNRTKVIFKGGSYIKKAAQQQSNSLCRCSSSPCKHTICMRHSFVTWNRYANCPPHYKDWVLSDDWYYVVWISYCMALSRHVWSISLLKAPPGTAEPQSTDQEEEGNQVLLQRGPVLSGNTNLRQ